MYDVLIVDDERIERDGIQFLIRGHGLPLRTVEAENGLKALAIVESRKIDILITDIKMPFMDGLQLAARIRESGQATKIVILSAFGEFDYAKRAIPLQIAHYLLKPIEVAEFLDVMNRVIRLCDEEREREARSGKLHELQQKGVKYEKEKLLIDAIHGSDPPESTRAKLQEAGLLGETASFHIVLLDTGTKCFDAAGDNMEPLFRQLLPWPFDYINLNEYQSVLFVKTDGEAVTGERLLALGRHIQAQFDAQFGAKACVVFSARLNDPANLAEAFQEMEQMLEIRFFQKEPVVCLAGSQSGEEPGFDVSHRLNELWHRISQAWSSGDKSAASVLIEALFRLLRESPRLSSIYVKYICTEIVKMRYGPLDRTRALEFQQVAEQIFKAQHIEQLEAIVGGAAAAEAPPDIESARKAIGEVLQIIHRDYRDDIGLETLAEQVYLSPNYLSRLFKKETGTSIVKYITAYRLEKACELLRQTNMKIVDIASETGYANFSYFCSIFRNYYGTTPAKFREGDGM